MHYLLELMSISPLWEVCGGNEQIRFDVAVPTTIKTKHIIPIITGGHTGLLL